MTLDEAIKQAKRGATFCKDQASKCDLHDTLERSVANEYNRSAEEYEQLAEWLKELKKLRKQDCALNKVRDEIEKLEVIEERYSLEGHDWATYMKDDVLEIIDKYREGEK